MNDLTVQASFAQDHDRLDQPLETYRRLKRVDFARAKQAFKEFKFGLQRHIIWEETVLFPLFEEKSGMHDRGPTAVMRAEHREIGQCLEALHDKVRRRRWTATLRNRAFSRPSQRTTRRKRTSCTR
jgi:iron-sulfur cluster repair protein YtfE (RIC family)